NQVHARAGARDVAHGEEQAGHKHGDAHHIGGGPAVIFADGVDGGHAGDDGQTVGGHHKGDAHKDDGNNQPDQGVPVVCAQHGGGGHRAGANDDAGGHQTGADPFQQFPQGQSFNVSAIDSFILTH